MTILSLECFQSLVIFILGQVLNLRLSAHFETALPAEHGSSITGFQISRIAPEAPPLLEGLDIAQRAETVRILVDLGGSLALIPVQNHLLKVLHPFLFLYKQLLGLVQTAQFLISRGSGDDV